MIYENTLQDVPFPFKCAIMRGNLPFMNHCHQELEILEVREGSLAAWYEDEEYKLTKGDLCIIPPFGKHSIGMSSENCQRLAILFDLEVLGTWTKDNQEWIELRKELCAADMISSKWTAETKEKMSALVNGLYLEYCEKDPAWQLAVKTMTNALMLTAVREMPRRKETYPEKQVNKMKDILEYIAKHYCSDITLANCAKAVGFNSTYLSRYFSSHMDITFQEYIKKLRIDRAKWLLMTEEIPVMDVCFQSGFRDVKTFNKLFRKECGKNPTEFRKEMKP